MVSLYPALPLSPPGKDLFVLWVVGKGQEGRAKDLPPLLGVPEQTLLSVFPCARTPWGGDAVLAPPEGPLPDPPCHGPRGPCSSSSWVPAKWLPTQAALPK